jgi:hypothetical protein
MEAEGTPVSWRVLVARSATADSVCGESCAEPEAEAVTAMKRAAVVKRRMEGRIAFVG